MYCSNMRGTAWKTNFPLVSGLVWWAQFCGPHVAWGKGLPRRRHLPWMPWCVSVNAGGADIPIQHKRNKLRYCRITWNIFNQFYVNFKSHSKCHAEVTMFIDHGSCNVFFSAKPASEMDEIGGDPPTKRTGISKRWLLGLANQASLRLGSASPKMDSIKREEHNEVE